MRQELIASQGDSAVDLEAKEQKFMDQIVMLLAQTAADGSSGSSAGDD